MDTYRAAFWRSDDGQKEILLVIDKRHALTDAELWAEAERELAIWGWPTTPALDESGAELCDDVPCEGAIIIGEWTGND